MLARRVGVAGITAGLRGLRVGAPACARCLATAPSERERTPTPEQVAANPADDVADASRRADIDRRRYGSTRENVAATELGEDISAGRSRTYVREDDIEKQTAATLYEILRQDLHRRQNLPLLREGVNLKRTGSGLAHTPDVRDVWLTPDGDRPAEKQKKTERQRQRDKHVVPQHRKYLAHGKVRTGGSPFKRQKLENNRRAVVARQRIAEREREAQGVEEEEKPQNAEGYQQLVEEKIQLAMSQGELDPTKNRYVGVDMLALSRGEGDPEVAAAFGRNGTRPAHVSTADFLVGERDRSQAILSLDCGFHTVALRVADESHAEEPGGGAAVGVHEEGYQRGRALTARGPRALLAASAPALGGVGGAGGGGRDSLAALAGARRAGGGGGQVAQQKDQGLQPRLPRALREDGLLPGARAGPGGARRSETRHARRRSHGHLHLKSIACVARTRGQALFAAPAWHYTGSAKKAMVPRRSMSKHLCSVRRDQGGR